MHCHTEHRLVQIKERKHLHQPTPTLTPGDKPGFRQGGGEWRGVKESAKISNQQAVIHKDAMLLHTVNEPCRS